MKKASLPVQSQRLTKGFRLPAAAPALRTPLSIAGSYPTPFAMMGHHEMNGGLTSPGVYAGLHISPQMSAAAAAAYGRSPMVTTPPDLKADLSVFISDHLCS